MLVLLAVRLTYSAVPKLEAYAIDKGVHPIRRHLTWWITDISQAVGFTAETSILFPRFFLSEEFRVSDEGRRLVELNGGTPAGDERVSTATEWTGTLADWQMWFRRFIS